MLTMAALQHKNSRVADHGLGGRQGLAKLARFCTSGHFNPPHRFRRADRGCATAGWFRCPWGGMLNPTLAGGQCHSGGGGVVISEGIAAVGSIAYGFERKAWFQRVF